MNVTLIVSNLNPLRWFHDAFRALACLCFASSVFLDGDIYFPLVSLGLLCWCASSFFVKRKK